MQGNAATQAAEEIDSRLNDDQVKLLNLSHDWLESLLPHVLLKINRVNYGLLQPRDLQRLMEEDGGGVPMTHRLNAVPFVGEDVPSRASEFAHPDVDWTHHACMPL